MTKGPQGDDIVILSREEYDQLIAAINEDAADIEILRRSITRVESGEEETFTSDEVDAFLASKTPLAFFRKKRGMSQDTLAKRAGITWRMRLSTFNCSCTHPKPITPAPGRGHPPCEIVRP
jgi:hypothetical protein